MSTPAPTLDLLQVAETGRAEDLQGEMLELANSSLYFFTKVILNFKELTDTFHKPFCDRMQEDEDHQDVGYLAGRGHFKSTMNKARVLWKYLHNHEERFLIIGESDTVAKSKLIDIRWHILNNQLLRWLYPELQGIDPSNTKWTDSEILLPREGSYDEPTITCDGIGAKRTGFHYTEITFEDVIGDKAASSSAIMDAAWDWIEYSRGLLHDPANSRRVFVGTRWKHGTADVYGKAMVAMPGIRWYVRPAIENGQPVFPERFSLKTLAAIREEEGDYKFNCQYMNDPTAPGGADFEAAWVKEYDVSDDGKTIIPRDGTPPVETRNLFRLGFYDISAGGKSDACENAIEILGMDVHKRIFFLEDWGKNCTIGQAVEQYHVMNDRWFPHKKYYESVGSQKVVEDFCKEREKVDACPYCNAGHLKDGKFIKNPHKKLRLEGFKHAGGSMNKEDRIRLYCQKPFEEGRVYLRTGMTVLRSQIIQFPHAPLVDRFDAGASGIKLLRPPLVDLSMQEGKTNAEFEHGARHGSPRTHTERDYGGY